MKKIVNIDFMFLRIVRFMMFILESDLELDQAEQARFRSPTVVYLYKYAILILY